MSVGKSAGTAIEGTPVVVVFFNIPVDNPAIEVPFILPTVVAASVPVTSPASEPVKLVAVATFRFGTSVVEVTTRGGVPVATVDVSCPVTLRLVPVAAPITGVTSVGEVFITKVEPVPVCDAIAVALPTLVIGPVRLALVALAAATNAVVAKVVLLVPAVCVTPVAPVGKDGAPVKTGDTLIAKVVPVPV